MNATSNKVAGSCWVAESSSKCYYFQQSLIVSGVSMDTLTVDDVAEQPTRIIHDAEKGEIALVTKEGRPLFVAVPVDEQLIKLGLPLALAIRLYEQEAVSLGKAAQIAAVSVSEFIDHLGARRIPVVRYSPKELEQEIAAFG